MVALLQHHIETIEIPYGSYDYAHMDPMHLSRRLARARVLLPLLKSGAGRELDARASSAQPMHMQYVSNGQ